MLLCAPLSDICPRLRISGEYEGGMQAIAIFDMDRTITKRGTYTAFLLFAAARRQHWRLVLAPLLLLALAGAGLGILSRESYKNFAFRLLIGPSIDDAALSSLAHVFVARTVKYNIHEATRAKIAFERDRDSIVVMATAAPGYYADGIGRLLGLDAVIATRQRRDSAGNYLAAIDGANCYGMEKLARIRSWMDAMGYDRSQFEIRFYSDHISDAPIFEWADCAIAVRPDRKLRALAQRRGWRVVDGSR